MRSNEEDGHRSHDSHEHRNRDGSWEHSSEEDWSGHDRDRDCSGEDHDGDGTYRTKMCFMFLFIIGVVIIVLIALCCCKKKNRRNMSVANLRVVIRPAQAKPTQVAEPTPEKSMKHFEALHVAPMQATAPQSQLGFAFGVPPPEYRSTVDLQANPRDTVGLASPPPAYESSTLASPV